MCNFHILHNFIYKYIFDLTEFILLECLHFTNEMKAVDEIQKFSKSLGDGGGERETEREGDSGC